MSTLAGRQRGQRLLHGPEASGTAEAGCIVDEEPQAFADLALVLDGGNADDVVHSGV